MDIKETIMDINETAAKVQSAVRRAMTDGCSCFQDYELAKASLPSDIVPERLKILKGCQHALIVQRYEPNNHLYKSDVPIRKKSTQKLPSSSVMNDVEEDTGLSYSSPLRLETFADLSLDDCDDFIEHTPDVTRYSPVSSKEARKFASLVSAARATFGDEDVGLTWPVVILCDGAGGDGVALMAYEVCDAGKMRVTSCTVKGPFTVDILRDMKEFKQMNNGPVSCYGLYNIDVSDGGSPDGFGGSPDGFGGSPDGFGGSVTVEVEWSQSRTVLEPPKSDMKMDVTATVLTASRDIVGRPLKLCEEMEFIRLLMRAKETGEMRWPKSGDGDPSSVRDSLRDCFKDLKSGDAYSCESQNDGKTDFLRFDKRTDYDFTDILWNVFVRCSSYADLRDALETTFRELKSGDLQPFVNDNNSTQMAKFAETSSSSLKFFVPSSLSPQSAFEVLIEMGLQKLNHDYLSILCSNDLATRNDLKSHVRADESIEAWFTTVEKLGKILEVVSALDVKLNISHATATSCVRQLFKTYDDDFDTNAAVRLSIPAKDIKTLLEKASPVVWLSSSVKHYGDVTEVNTCHFSINPPLKHLCTQLPCEDAASVKYYALKVEQTYV